MGFTIPEKTGLLDYSSTEYAGAEVRVNLSVPLGVFFEIEERQADGNVKEMLQYFVEHCIVSWNLEDQKGNTVPVTFEGLSSWPVAFAMLTVQAWIEAVTPSETPLSAAESEDEYNLDLASLSAPV